jgi:hypothetical protein
MLVHLLSAFQRKDSQLEPLHQGLDAHAPQRDPNVLQYDYHGESQASDSYCPECP